MICIKDNVVAQAHILYDGKKRDNWTVKNLVEFSKGQMDIVRCEKIGQANVVCNKCSDDTQGTAGFGNSTIESELNLSTKIEIEHTTRRL